MSEELVLKIFKNFNAEFEEYRVRKGGLIA